MSHYPTEILTLIAYLKKLPGVGRKTAERFAFYLLEWPESDIQNFSTNLRQLQEKVTSCSTCRCLQENGFCPFCNSPKRDQNILCLVSSVKDVFAMEETKVFKGIYHVLGGLLSPLEGRSERDLSFDLLGKRFGESQIEEVIIALDSTLEGDATALYAKEKLENIGVKTTRLAFGLPMGSSLDFVDYGTLEKAFTGRRNF